jgi:hypothetical protein
MKNLKISIIFFGAVFLLVLSSLTASAVSDPEDDVYYKIIDGSIFRYELYGARDKIDITDISYSTSGSDITVSLTVKDAIDTSSLNIIYWVYLQAVDGNEDDYYYFSYSQGQGLVSSAGVLAGYSNMTPTFEISADGKTLSYTFTDVDTSNEYEPWGFSADYFDFSQQEGGEAWLDYAPDTYSDWYGINDDPGGNGNGGGNSGNGDGTGGSTPDNDSPGFGIIALIAGLALLTFIFRKKK